MHLKLFKVSGVATFLTFVLSACGSDSATESEFESPADNYPFKLEFAAKSRGDSADCDTLLTGFGSDNSHSIKVSDLRFYVSNIQLYDLNGENIHASFDDSEFQLNHQKGFVGLIDLTSNTSGACTDAQLSGTQRDNSFISGVSQDNGIRAVSFDIGVPQSVMKSVINAYSVEDAPTPLNEMYWSWASGYRHFVLNFQIETDQGVSGQGLVHIGSRDCGGDGLVALTEKEQCDFINTAKVHLENFDPNLNTILIDLPALLADVRFTATTIESSNGEHTLGHASASSSPRVSCHSSPQQVDCPAIFENLGIKMSDGRSQSSTNKVFIKN
ncbi:MbnP family copper-binding protein [Gayadomonas joobiniege]|uniref:MbnP family copper-binding protein n=1 Tax=Gayadomonas joobiniege TaxID=1234606 RepID=UPI000370B42A|nr:MbnP family copper-binding protein [Gayadomonas joobiniege]